MAEMVWCKSCKKVVWAYDHQPPVDLGGICNMLRLPCPQCGAEGNFDGWDSNNILSVVESSARAKEEIYDWWSAMKYIATQYKVEWCPSPDNRWFPKSL